MVRSMTFGAVIAAAAVACAPPDTSDAPHAPGWRPTFHADIAPIVRESCAECHREGGSAPFALETYEDVADRAGHVAHVTRERIMPPWPADDRACSPLVGSRVLDDAAIAAFTAWHAAGAPEGDPVDTPASAPPSATPFSESVVLAAAAPYVVQPGPDEYRCFVVDPALASDQYITAIQMTLDRADVVHHMQLFASDDDQTDAALLALDAADAAPGYACGEDGLGTDVRYVGVWAPGDRVRRWPPGTGIFVRGGHRLVVQLHYHNHGAAAVADHTRVGVELADRVDLAGDIHHARNTALYLPPGLATIDAIGEHPLSQPAVARAVRIHMHQLGTTGRLELVRGDTTTCLLAIPRWDFGWQLFYELAEPVALVPGDRIRLTCTYDTRSREQPVRWGLGTSDEMCIGYTYFTAH